MPLLSVWNLFFSSIGEGEYTEDYDDYYDEDNLPDLSSSSDINRVAGANEANSSSGTVGIYNIECVQQICIYH